MKLPLILATLMTLVLGLVAHAACPVDLEKDCRKTLRKVRTLSVEIEQETGTSDIMGSQDEGSPQGSGGLVTTDEGRGGGGTVPQGGGGVTATDEGRGGGGTAPQDEGQGGGGQMGPETPNPDIAEKVRDLCDEVRKGLRNAEEGIRLAKKKKNPSLRAKIERSRDELREFNERYQCRY